MSYYMGIDEIYNQMKTYITNADTSENSYIYNALYPSATEISYCLLMMDQVENKVFASKAVVSGYSDYLELRVNEVGIFRKPATFAQPEVTFSGKTNTKIDKGSIVSTNDNRVYTTTTETYIGVDGTVTVQAIADKVGSVYNVKSGDINYLPVKYSGVTSVINKNNYTEAYDKETDVDLYARYLLHLQTPATSGNIHHYEQWCLECTGVGAVKVYPLKDENFQAKNGNVTCVITDSNKKSASSTLIQLVKEYIDPNDGTGEGQAPIGATVHIVTPSEIPINITANVQIDTSTTLDIVSSSLSTLVTSYLSDIVFSTKKVNLVKIGSLLLDIVGVQDYSNLKLNGSDGNAVLSEMEIGVMGTITLGIML